MSNHISRKLPPLRAISPLFHCADSDFASADCQPSVCLFKYSEDSTPYGTLFTNLGGPWGYASLGGSAGHVYRSAGLIRGQTADNSADGSFAIQLGGLNCDVDPLLQYYSGSGTTLVDSSGRGIVKWCVCSKEAGGWGSAPHPYLRLARIRHHAVALRILSPPAA